MDKMSERKVVSSEAPEWYSFTGAEEVSIEIVDAEMAKEMLAAQINKRPMRAAWVREYADLMTRKKWGLSQDAIVVDIDGHLRNGQHRLQAIVDTGMAQYLVVLRGVSPEIDKNCDMGKRRTVKDLLEKPAAFCAAVRGFYSLPGNKLSKVPVWVVEEGARRIGDIVDSVVEICGGKQARVFRLAPFQAAVARASCHLGMDLMREVVSVMRGDIHTGNPAWSACVKLIQSLGDSSYSGGQDSQRDVYLRVTSAIEAYANRRALGKIYATDRDRFPIPPELRISGFSIEAP